MSDETRWTTEEQEESRRGEKHDRRAPREERVTMWNRPEDVVRATTWTYDIDDGGQELDATLDIQEMLARGLTIQQAADLLASEVADNATDTPDFPTLEVELRGTWPGIEDDPTTYGPHVTGRWARPRIVALCFDDTSDPARGWLLRISDAPGEPLTGWDEILGVTDRDAEATARAHAEAFLAKESFTWEWAGRTRTMTREESAR